MINSIIKYDYGEILFLGKCNNKCYYCLGNEMPKAKLVSNLKTPYNELKNLDVFLEKLANDGCKTIYLSSTITEPMLYEDINRLCDYLILKGFMVGIRTNGVCDSFIDLIPKLDAEISISINSLTPTINKSICGNSKIPNMCKILDNLSKHNKKCRISMVVNKYNFNEIPSIISKLQSYNSVSYIQLRKRYVYNKVSDALFEEDSKSFYNIKEYLDAIFLEDEKSNFHESIIYNSRVPISLWEDVFKKESLKTLNYFSDGKITSHNLLVPSYEKE